MGRHVEEAAEGGGKRRSDRHGMDVEVEAI
jgi:hypothetical protein